jgi:hypothetical protein
VTTEKSLLVVEEKLDDLKLEFVAPTSGGMRTTISHDSFRMQKVSHPMGLAKGINNAGSLSLHRVPNGSELAFGRSICLCVGCLCETLTYFS